VNLDTQAARTEVTDSSGIYRFCWPIWHVPAGGLPKGFKRFSRTGILLNAGETTTADVNLDLGELTEQLPSRARRRSSAPRPAALGATISQRTIAELPLQGRNPYVFLSLSAGIQYNGDPARSTRGQFRPSAFSTNGSKANAESSSTDAEHEAEPGGLQPSPTPLAKCVCRPTPSTPNTATPGRASSRLHQDRHERFPRHRLEYFKTTC